MIDWLGIGAQRSGTAWTYQMLKRHPQIYTKVKECHFWCCCFDPPPFYWNEGSRDQRGWNHKPPPKYSLDQYLAFFQEKGNKKAGEFTPAYAMLRLDIIEKIYSLNPNLKIIYTIRNPIHRGWSHACLAHKKHYGKDSLAKATNEYLIAKIISAASTYRSDYISAVKNWTRVFGGKNILVRRYDFLTKSPAAYIKRCLRHIGVNDSLNYLSKQDLTRVINSSQPQSKHQPIRPEVLAVLHETYDDKIDEMSEFFKIDLSYWKEEPY